MNPSTPASAAQRLIAFRAPFTESLSLGDVFVESHPPNLSYWREPWHIEDVLPIPTSPTCANGANRCAVG